MQDSDHWPSVSDPRLLAVLQAQIEGALQDLHVSTEEGLGHLARIIESHPDSELVPHVLSALTELQGIDRAAQRPRHHFLRHRSDQRRPALRPQV